MAAGDHNPSRRALLGAAVALPLIARHPGPDPGSTFRPARHAARWTPDQVRGDEGEWTQALALFRRDARRLLGMGTASE